MSAFDLTATDIFEELAAREQIHAVVVRTRERIVQHGAVPRLLQTYIVDHAAEHWQAGHWWLLLLQRRDALALGSEHLREFGEV